MQQLILVLALATASCNRSAPPAPAPAEVPALLPDNGVLRVTSRSGFPEDLKSESLTPGLPVPHAGMEYVGPRSWLEIETDCRVKGELREKGENRHEVLLPMLGSVGIGFGEDRAPNGSPSPSNRRPRMLRLNDGVLSFRMEFWTLD